ncbi:MAG: sensor histidine kinase [Arachnia sp.]
MAKDRRPAEADIPWLEPLLACLAFLIILASAPVANRSPQQWVIEVGLCVAAGLSARWPRVAAALGITALLTELTLPPETVGVAGLALFVNLFSAFRLRLSYSLPLTLLSAGTLYVVMVHYATASTSQAMATGIFLLIMLTLATGAGALWRIAVEQLAKEKELADKRLRDLRLELARDLHDTVAQTLSHAAMRAYLAADDPSVTHQVREELEQVASDCATSAQDLRQVLSTLRALDGTKASGPSPVANASTLRADVDEQAQRLRRNGLVPQIRVDISTVSATRAATLSKVMVEATTNMIKHAPRGSRGRLSIVEDHGTLRGEFSNVTSGRPRNRKGLGLIGMEERIKLLSGTYQIDEAGDTWTLRVTLPRGIDTEPARDA